MCCGWERHSAATCPVSLNPGAIHEGRFSHLARRCTVGAATLLLLACADQSAENPVGPRSIAPTQSLSSQSANQAESTGFVLVERNGKLKKYRIKVNKKEKRIEFSSTATCDPETDTSCEEVCEPTMETCDPCEYDPLSCDTVEQIDEVVTGRGLFGNVQDASSLPAAECPARVSGGFWVGWRGHDFIIWGDWIRQTSLRSWPWGTAEYAIPAGPHESKDGRAIIYSGVVVGRCFGGPNRYGEWEGIIVVDWARGDAKELPASSGSGGGTFAANPGGWMSTGDEEADVVVRRFLETGVCSEGWVIIVDDVRVC